MAKKTTKKAAKSNELDGKEFFAAVTLIEKEKGIPRHYMLEKITQALVSAYKRDHEGVTDNVFVEANEITETVRMYVKKEIVEFKKDEYPKAGVTKEGIAKLKGAFPVGPESPNPQVVHTFEVTGAQDAADKGQQRVTAANASGINDGAAAIVLASGEAVAKYGLKPMAKLISWGQGGVDPKIMGVGPVPASRQAMAKAGVTIDDIDLIEANEAFAAQSIAVARELHFDINKVNVNGGAISLGHPVGASGARIIVTLLHEMQKRDDAKKGLATLCIGGGMGVATIFEKC